MFLRSAVLAVFATASLASAEYLREADDHPKPAIVGSVKKGVKCEGGGTPGKFGGKTCEGGVEYDISGKPLDNVIGTIAHDLHSSMVEEVLDATTFVPDDKTMEELQGMEEELGSLEEGVEKTVEFGGMAHMEWGCKVTFKVTKGKFSKHAECGFKGKEGMGKKPSKDLYKTMAE